MTLLVDLTGFTLAHKIYYIENNSIVGDTRATIKNIPEVICNINYAHGNNVEKVILSGNEKYSKDIKERIYYTYLTKYEEECPFEIVQR